MTAQVQTQTHDVFAIAAKALQSAEAYMAQHDKIEKAFATLEAEQERMAQEHKDVLATAGNAEASRLLGETPAISPKKIDASLMRVRDQQDRMDAAKQGLSEKKRALFAELETQAESTNSALSELTRTIERELDEELQAAAEKINGIVNRYYALYSGSHYGSLYKRQVFEMKIPSLVDGRNLFCEPARYHPRSSEVVAAAWKEDKEAFALHERISPLGLLNRKLRSMEESFLDRGGLASL